MRMKPVAIVLGGTSPHIALIEDLKRRNYYTVLIDYLDNPPAKSFSDKHIRESTLNQAKVLELARSLNAKLVISACIDQANATACYVSEKLNLPLPYSYETALNVTNKALMKKKMQENGIPTSGFVIVSNYDDFEHSDLRLPVVVKPIDSTGSKGVMKAESSKELKEYLNLALQISRSKMAIIEEFKNGIEVQVDVFVKNQIPYIVMMRQKCRIGSHSSVLQSAGSIIPAPISLEVKNSIHGVTKKITEAFQLNNSPLFIQAIVNETEISVIEFAFRIGGGLSYKMIKHITGFDILKSTVDSYLESEINLNFHEPPNFYSTSLLYCHPCRFSHVTGYEKLLQEKIIEEFYVLKTPGTEIESDLISRNRVAAFLTKAPTKESLTEKVNHAFNCLEIYDTEGRPRMRRDTQPAELSLH